MRKAVKSIKEALAIIEKWKRDPSSIYKAPKCICWNRQLGGIRKRFRHSLRLVTCKKCWGRPTVLPCPQCWDHRRIPSDGIPIFRRRVKIRRRAKVKDLIEAGFFRYEGWLSADTTPACRIFEHWLRASKVPGRKARKEKRHWERMLAELGWFRKPPAWAEVEELWQQRRVEEGRAEPPKHHVRFPLNKRRWES